jgi:hypothetical protein
MAAFHLNEWRLRAPLSGRGGSLNLFIFFGHGTGGRPGGRLMKRLGLPVSDDTILRQLKKHVAA